MEIGSVFRGADVSASGLRAQRVRMEVAAANIANVETTRTSSGEPWRRQIVVLESAAPGAAGGLAEGGSPAPVEVAGVVGDPSPFQLVHRPGHPDADAEGYVAMPNVNLAMEMVDLSTAARAYEANLSALRTWKSMGDQALSIGGGA